METNYSYVYKKLDEAHLGHEEAKQWLLSHVGEVLNFVDDLVADTIEPLRSRITALEEEIDDNEADIDSRPKWMGGIT